MWKSFCNFMANPVSGSQIIIAIGATFVIFACFVFLYIMVFA